MFRKRGALVTMNKENNNGYDAKVISSYREKMSLSSQSFLFAEDDETTPEYAHFYFVGKHENREVIYDAVLYTLRLQHESELFEIAEHKAAQHFPGYKKIIYDEDENGNLEKLDDMEEEIGLFMAEVIMELEEEEHVKVKEHVDIDHLVDFGIALDIGLHVPEITPKVIEEFIRNFNENKLHLDDTLYSFQIQDETVD